MNSPYKINFIFIGYFHKLLQLGCFLFRIRQTPVGSAVIRIVFRTVDIGIHLILTIKLQLAKTCLMAPGSSVEALHYTAITDRRIIFDFHFRQFSFFQQLGECLNSIISAPFIIAGQYDFFIIDSQIITFFMFGNQLVILTYTFVSLLTNINTDSFLGTLLAGKDTLQRFHRMRVCFFFTFYPVDSRKTECFTLFIELLWGRL